ncbi:MAG: Na+/H+ antiporter subunit E [bacterium]
MMHAHFPRARSRLLPAPLLTLTLAVFWLLLNNTVDPAHVVLGLLLGWALPLATRALCGAEDRPAGRGWRWPALRSLLSLAVVVAIDVIRSNIEVAVLILGPKRRIRSRFIEVPVSLDDPVAVAVLAGIVTMTPGTLSAGISADRRVLTIHCLHAPDPVAVIASITTRYERPLAEIFSCSTTRS